MLNTDPATKKETIKMITDMAVEKASNDLLFFLENFVLTHDEHDEESPIKPIPMEKEYLKELAELWLRHPLLLIEKSRQMMVTWLITACYLWDVQFHAGRRVFFQSKKEGDANANVDRAKFIYDHQPEYMKAMFPANQPMAYLKLQFGKQNSIIQGTPQGPDVLRQYTASGIFSDETAFQEKAEDAYTAAIPTIMGGGRYTMVSSPNFKEFFYRTRSDKLGKKD